MTRVQVHLLGRAKVRFDTSEAQFLPDKRFHLLTYLAYQEDWVGREQLLYLFWSESVGESARNNLRQLLRRVRDLEFASLEMKGQYLRWPVTSDVAAFKGAVSKTRWAEALGHYTGPLLEDFIAEESPEFSTWLDLERERLREQWRLAVQRRAEELETQGWYLEAAGLLKTLVDGDDLDEQALKAYMKMTVQAGGREQALEAYQDFATRLREELDLSPTTDLEQLAKAIRAGDLPVPKTKPAQLPAQVATRTTASLPTSGSAFVGRDLELAEVSELLSKEECRLLTLTGVGGVGKTRMALQVAAQLSHGYPDGVCFVNLDALDAPGPLPVTVADALKLRLEGPDDALIQITKHLAHKRLLLVLDNFEHLLEGAPLASELIRQCPHLKLLVTSRESLNLSEEWRFPMGGLSYPEQKSVSLEESQYFDAVRLFVQRVKQVQPGFVLSQDDLPFVLQICQKLEGSALGLELAAVWAKTLPLAEIAKEISDNLDFLASSSRNAKKRHQSIRAVFDYSWELLTPKEQEVLRKLSVFVGGFSKEAARQVADASLPILAALVDKSLLRVSPNGRYDRHMLVYQYSQEKLAEVPQEKEQTESKHGAYYLQLLREQVGFSHTAKRKVARQILAQDYNNIHTSWAWAVAQKQPEIIRHTAFALSDFFEGHRQDGLETFARAAAALGETNPQHWDTKHRAALAYVLLGQAIQQRSLSNSPKKTKALSERAVALLEKLEDDYGLARGLCELADDEAALGHHAKAQELLTEALTLARRAGEPTLIGRILCLRSLQNRETASAQEARDFIEGALRELSEMGSSNHQAYLLLIYGASLVYEGHLEEGEARLEESLRLSDDLGGEQDFRVYIFLDLARAAHKRGAFEESEALLRQARLEAEHLSLKRPESEILWLLGRAKAAQGAFAEAHDHFARSLRVAWDKGQEAFIATALVYLAELRLLEGKPERAAELLTVARGQALDKRERDEMEPLVRTLKQQLSRENFKKAEARGRALSLGAVVFQVLAESYGQAVINKES
jgi:predicted ATPase/DNA-binding SARP family transcriptional activator